MPLTIVPRLETFPRVGWKSCLEEKTGGPWTVVTQSEGFGGRKESGKEAFATGLSLRLSLPTFRLRKSLDLATDPDVEEM